MRNQLGSDVSVAKAFCKLSHKLLCMPAAKKKKDQGETGLENVLRVLKMELHCNARRTGHKNMQFSNTFFCSMHILGAFSSLPKILVILFVLTF